MSNSKDDVRFAVLFRMGAILCPMIQRPAIKAGIVTLLHRQRRLNRGSSRLIRSRVSLLGTMLVLLQGWIGWLSVVLLRVVGRGRCLSCSGALDRV